jgi:hypothetical protein
MSDTRATSRSVSWASLAAGLGAVLLPKCPLCFAAYGSAVGALGVGPDVHEEVVAGLLVLAVTISFGVVLALSLRRRDAVTPALSAAGAILVLGGRLVFDSTSMTMLGAVLLVTGAVLNTIRCRRVIALR